LSYKPHKNAELKEAFAKEPLPYQGADPEKAKCVFIGLDANFDEDIEKSPIFSDVLSYLRNGLKFWRDKGIHHPFLLDAYTGDGRFYHESFACIGFTPEHADCVSFVELLPFPTYGKSDLDADDLKTDKIQKHLQLLNEIIVRDNQYVFISPRVGQLMKASKLFSWMPNQAIPDPARRLVSLKLWKNDFKVSAFWHYHFAVWQRRYQGEKQRQAAEIKRICMNR
jgi:hypothetical protein